MIRWYYELGYEFIRILAAVDIVMICHVGSGPPREFLRINYISNICKN